VNDLVALVQILLVAGLTVSPVIALVHWIAGGDPDIVGGAHHSGTFPWPRGVQEPEPVRWRLAGA
jgi:hypothetical protein